MSRAMFVLMAPSFASFSRSTARNASFAFAVYGVAIVLANTSLPVALSVSV